MADDLDFALDSVLGGPGRARATAVGNAVANPEQAGEAHRLSRETGAPAEVINEDLPGFKSLLQQRKTESAMQRPSILEYVENNPMASKVSNDDWDALHKLGRVAKLVSSSKYVADIIPSAIESTTSTFKNIGAGWAEYDPATQGTLQSTLTVGKALGQSLLSTVALPFMPAIGAIAAPVGHGLADAEHFIGGYLNPQVAARDDLQEMYLKSRSDAEMALSVIGGGLRNGKRMPGISTPEEIETFLSIVRGRATRDEIDAFLRSKAAEEKVGPQLLLTGPETIPAGTGVHPVVDTLHIERAKFDAAGVDKLVELADAAKTKERSPELLSKFLEPIARDRTVGIPVEAIEPLYRASAPEPGDGLLGFVPDLPRRIEVAKATGGDVVVPLADYLAWVPKELHTQLAPNLRLREEGVTLEESKELQKEVDKGIEAYHGSPATFEAFDSQYMGSGEGAQAYAYGHYVAENKSVAEQYQLKLAPDGVMDKGQLYKVRINQPPEAFLDWDKSIAEQSLQVQEALKKLGFDKDLEPAERFTGERIHRELMDKQLDKGLIKDLENQTVSPSDSTENIKRSVAEELKKVGIPGVRFLDQGSRPANTGKSSVQFTGGEYHVYDGLDGHAGSFKTIDEAKAEAKRIEQQAGPSPEKQTRNYVVFDDKDLTITHRNDVPLTKAVAAEPGAQAAANTTAEATLAEKKALYLTPLFKDAKAAGMTEAAFKAYSRKIERSQIEADEAAIASAEKEVRRRQTAEWKKAEAEITDEVKTDLRFDPTHLADRYFRTGDVPGGIIEKGLKISLDDATEILKKLNEPKKYTLELSSSSGNKQIFNIVSPQGITGTARFIINGNVAELDSISNAGLSNSIGPSGIRSLLRQFKEMNPDITEITATRTSGARSQGSESFPGEEINIELPKEAISKNGVSADDLAQIFGFGSGKEMVKALAELSRVRGDESPAQFAAKLQKAEVQARMEQRFGELDRNIYNEAREAALSEVQFDLLADELKALALQIEGAGPVMTKEALQAFVESTFAGEPLVQGARYEAFVRQAGAAGKKAEMALLKGDFAEAFVEKQRQFLSMWLAKEAKAFQKLKAKTDKAINRVLTTESIKSMDQAHLEQARAMLEGLGYPNPHPKALTESLQDFVKASDGQLAVSSEIIEGSVHLQDMTVQQYRDLAKSLDSLMHVGREVKTVANVHGKAELDNVIHDIKSELDRFNLIEQPLNPTVGQRVKALGRWVTAVHLLVERMFDYTDKFNPNGPITAFLDRPLRDAYSNELKLVEQTAGKLRSLGKYVDKSINELIDNKVLPDEFDRSGFLKMTRNNLRHLMLNMGNESNIAKVTKGFGVDADVVWDLIHDNATKADWQWVQGIWDIFAELKPLADAMQLRDTGVAADTIKSVSVTTPHGEFAGGYAPIIYDKMRSNIEGDIAKKGGLFDQNYFQATTPHAYTIPRTGYAGALDLTGTYLGNKIQGVIHDIAFREAVRNANKLISNKEFMQEMTKKWSKEYTGLLNGWLKDIANVHNVDDSYAMGAARFAAALRQNIVSTLIAFNPGTYIKHGLTAASMSVERVGTVELAKAVKDIGFAGAIKSARDLVKMEHEPPPSPEFSAALKEVIDPGERGEMTREFVLNNSALMRNRQRQYLDSIRGAYESINNAGPLQNLADIRQMAMMIGRAPVAFSDAMSAMPTWLAAYKAEIAKGSPHADAVFAADKEVSRAHGSNFIGDKPRVTRTGEAMRWVTPLYNFWNHMANNYFQGAWDIASMVRGGEKEPRANMQSLINRMFWLVIIPIAVEEMASPALDEHRESLGVKAAKAAIRHFGASFVGVRDLTNALASGYEPSVGLIGTVARSITNQARDIRNAIQNKKVSNDWIIHATTALGMATGIGGAQVGKTGGFLVNVARGTENPQGYDQWRQGLRTGHSKPRVFK